MSKFNVEIQKKIVDTIRYVFQVAIVADRNFIKEFAVSNLIGGRPSLLRGAPGVGKTSLIRAWARAFFGEEAVVLNFVEGVRIEDLIFETMIETHQLSPKVSRFVFNVEARDYMNSKFALLNEMNRADKPVQDSWMSIFAEGKLKIQGKMLHKKYGKDWIDMNPYYGEFDRAFADRAITSLVMRACNNWQQLELMNRKEAAQTDDLTTLIEPQLAEGEMEQAWEDVSKIPFPKELQPKALLYLNSFRVCKYELDAASERFLANLPCENCQYTQTCITKLLEYPVLTRSLDSFKAVAKAHAYLNGRNYIDEDLDFGIATKMAVVHRMKLKPNQLEEFPHEYEWFDKRGTQILKDKEEHWSAADEVHREIKDLIETKKVKEAISTYNKFTKNHTEITSKSVVADFCDGQILSLAEEEFEKDSAKINMMMEEELPFTLDDVNEIEKTYDWLPETLKEELENRLNRLRDYLTGLYLISLDNYKGLLKDLSSIDSDVVKKGVIGKQINVTVDTPDFRFNVMRAVDGDDLYQLKFQARTSESAKVFHQYA